jgi:hypothetical protein
MFHFEDNVATMTKFNEMVDQIEAARYDEGIYTPLTDAERESIYNMLVNKAEHNPINEMVADEYDLDRTILDEVKTQFIEMQVRALIENLPYWYKIKGTDDSLKILLYSFGLIADIHNYYTEDYSPNRQNWEVADVFYNTSKLKSNANNVNALSEDFSNIPDDWYPTPHFQVKFDFNATWANSGKTGVLSDMEKFGSMIEAIHASKPINNVFKGLAGIFRTSQAKRVGVKEVIRITHASTVYTPPRDIIGYVVDDPASPTSLTIATMRTAATKFSREYVDDDIMTQSSIDTIQSLKAAADISDPDNASIDIYYDVTSYFHISPNINAYIVSEWDPTVELPTELTLTTLTNRATKFSATYVDDITMKQVDIDAIVALNPVTFTTLNVNSIPTIGTTIVILPGGNVVLGTAELVGTQLNVFNVDDEATALSALKDANIDIYYNVTKTPLDVNISVEDIISDRVLSDGEDDNSMVVYLDDVTLANNISGDDQVGKRKYTLITP